MRNVRNFYVPFIQVVLILFIFLSVRCSYNPSTIEEPPSPTPSVFPSSSVTPMTQLVTSTKIIPSTPFPITTVSHEVPLPSATAARPIIASYFVGWADGVDEINACLFGYGQYRRILYADGQLVVRTADGFLEAHLSEDEIDSFLAQIEDTGFFQIQGDGSQYENDPIYSLPENYKHLDGAAASEIIIQQKRVTICCGLFDYLIPEVRNAWDIFVSYKPESAARYVTKLLELWIYKVNFEEVSLDQIRLTPIPPIIEWPYELPPLHTLYGETLPRVILDTNRYISLTELFPRLPSSRFVTQEDGEYLIGACPVLP